MDKTKELLTKILGEEAINDLEYQVPSNIQKLAKVVNYLIYQINYVKKNSDNDDIKDYIDDVVLEANNILES
jgi:transcriptional regulator with AAA-type ATPase domain